MAATVQISNSTTATASHSTISTATTTISSSTGENLLDDDIGILSTVELSQGATTLIDELTPSGVEIMQTSEVNPNSRKDTTFALTNVITTARPCKFV